MGFGGKEIGIKVLVLLLNFLSPFSYLKSENNTIRVGFEFFFCFFLRLYFFFRAV